MCSYYSIPSSLLFALQCPVSSNSLSSLSDPHYLHISNNLIFLEWLSTAYWMFFLLREPSTYTFTPSLASCQRPCIFLTSSPYSESTSLCSFHPTLFSLGCSFPYSSSHLFFTLLAPPATPPVLCVLIWMVFPLSDYPSCKPSGCAADSSPVPWLCLCIPWSFGQHCSLSALSRWSVHYVSDLFP